MMRLESSVALDKLMLEEMRQVKELMILSLLMNFYSDKNRTLSRQQIASAGLLESAHQL